MSDTYEQLFAPLWVPEELAAGAKAAGWPDGLVGRMLDLRFGRRWVEQVIADAVPLERLTTLTEERERLRDGTLRCRSATRADAGALSELFLASPEKVGDWEVTVDRSPNPFAQFDLQEHAAIVLLEDRSVPVATFNVSAKNAIVGGHRITVQLVGAWRTRTEARGLGYSALIRNNWGVPLGLPFSPGQYWYIRSQNVDAVNWMRALDEKLLISTHQKDDVTGIPVTVHELAAAPYDGDPTGIRPSRPDDLRRCVDLINRTHRGLDLFRPYTTEYLGNKLDERFWGDRPVWWERNYGWDEHFVVEADGAVVACAGLWDRGRDVREMWRNLTTGEQQVRNVTNVLDFGCARGHEDDLARLLRYLAGRTQDLGRSTTVAPLQFLPRVRDLLADLNPITDTRGLAWLMSGPDGPLAEPPIEPRKPYTDLAYW